MIYLRKHAAGPHPPVDDALRRRYPVGWDVTTEHVLDPRSTEIYRLIFGRPSPAMRVSLTERFRALCRSPSDCAYSAMHFRPSRRDPFNAKIKAAQCDETVRTYCRRGELEIGPTVATAACEARNIPLCAMAPSYVGAELRKRACPLDRGHVFLATAETAPPLLRWRRCSERIASRSLPVTIGSFASTELAARLPPRAWRSMCLHSPLRRRDALCSIPPPRSASSSGICTQRCRRGLCRTRSEGYTGILALAG